MLPLLTLESLRRIEIQENSKEPLKLSNLAGIKIAQFIEKNLNKISRILFLIGPGMKGVDALNAIDHIVERLPNIKIKILSTREVAEKRLIHNRYKESSTVETLYLWPNDLSVDLIVDALFGIGLNRPITEPFSDWLYKANQTDCIRYAIDIPSGLDAETGCAMPCTFKANFTHTLIAPKIGLYTADGPDYCGQVICDNLGISYQEDGFLVNKPLLTYSHLGSTNNTHKSMFGDIGIIGGSMGMLGAPLMSANAALNCGAGRVWISLLNDMNQSLVSIYNPQLMTKQITELIHSDLDMLIVGPGSLVQDYNLSLIKEILSAPYPIILDAGILPTLINPDLKELMNLRQAPTIITPHPGEAAKLLGRPVKNRVQDALSLAKQFKAWTILKGQGTIISSADGRWWINHSGNSALSIPGSGDVLCGVIASCIKRFESIEKGIINAIYLHGQAANDFKAKSHGTIGMSYSELIYSIRQHLNNLFLGH